MAEVAVAFFAGDLDANHAEAGVARDIDGVVDRRVKCRPTAAGVVLGFGQKQRRAAGFADVGAVLVMMIVFAGERPLGAFLPEDAILLGRQLGPPLGIGLDDFCLGGLLRFHYRFVLNWLNGLGRRPGLGVDVGAVNWLRHRLGLGRRCGWAGFWGGRRGVLFPPAAASQCHRQCHRENRILHAPNQSTLRRARQPWPSTAVKCRLVFRGWPCVVCLPGLFARVIFRRCEKSHFLFGAVVCAWPGAGGRATEHPLDLP